MENSPEFVTTRNKIVIGILSCKKNGKLRETARKTWLLNCPYRYYFFIGGERPEDAKADEVYLDCPDSYEALVAKTVNMVDYLKQFNNDYLLKCDDDSYVNWRHLERITFDQKDYLGKPVGNIDRRYFYDKVPKEFQKPFKEDLFTAYALGMGYFLSKRAMRLLLDSSEKKWDGQMGLEDEYVGRVLSRHGIALNLIQGFFLGDIERIFAKLILQTKKTPLLILHHCTATDMIMLHNRMRFIVHGKYFLANFLNIIVPRVIGQFKSPHIPLKIKNFFKKNAH